MDSDDMFMSDTSQPSVDIKIEVKDEPPETIEEDVNTGCNCQKITDGDLFKARVLAEELNIKQNFIFFLENHYQGYLQGVESGVQYKRFS